MRIRSIYLVAIAMINLKKSVLAYRISNKFHFYQSLNCQFESSSRSVDSTESYGHHAFSVAPMMDYTDCHMRYLIRLITRQSVLYTEMVAANALVRTEDAQRYLEANFLVENPVVLQLGGSCPKQMKEASRLASKYGYNEININVGCPSEKVAGAGCFGAALMLKPHLVSELCLASSEATNRPTTVKCRIGVDDNDSYEQLVNFIRHVTESASVKHFIVHARKAVLGANFSPEYNRKVPPLRYDYVYQLVRDFPSLIFTINGGILCYEDVLAHIGEGRVHGVMVGRGTVNTPYYWRNIDSLLYGCADPGLSRRKIIEQYSEYASHVETTQGAKARRALLKPILNLFAGEPNGRIFRAQLDDLIRQPELSMGTIFHKAAEVLPEAVLDDCRPVEIEEGKRGVETVSLL